MLILGSCLDILKYQLVNSAAILSQGLLTTGTQLRSIFKPHSSQDQGRDSPTARNKQAPSSFICLMMKPFLSRKAFSNQCSCWRKQWEVSNRGNPYPGRPSPLPQGPVLNFREDLMIGKKGYWKIHSPSWLLCNQKARDLVTGQEQDLIPERSQIPWK